SRAESAVSFCLSFSLLAVYSCCIKTKQSEFRLHRLARQAGSLATHSIQMTVSGISWYDSLATPKIVTLRGWAMITTKRVTVAGIILGGSFLFIFANQPDAQEHKHAQGDTAAKNGFSRMKPGPSGPVDGDAYHGKLVSGYRSAGLPPVPLTTPDLPKLT